jgi:hypothetical protein
MNETKRGKQEYIQMLRYVSERGKSTKKIKDTKSIARELT